MNAEPEIVERSKRQLALPALIISIIAGGATVATQWNDMISALADPLLKAQAAELKMEHMQSITKASTQETTPCAGSVHVQVAFPVRHYHTNLVEAMASCV